MFSTEDKIEVATEVVVEGEMTVRVHTILPMADGLYNRGLHDPMVWNGVQEEHCPSRVVINGFVVYDNTERFKS